jgi:molybdopterin synthase sulfur carrier subunit
LDAQRSIISQAGGLPSADSLAGDAMQVKLKLMGLLRDKTPPGGTLELPDGATLDDLLMSMQIPDTQVQVISINGKFERNRARALAADDEVTILPPVGGG